MGLLGVIIAIVIIGILWDQKMKEDSKKGSISSTTDFLSKKLDYVEQRIREFTMYFYHQRHMFFDAKKLEETFLIKLVFLFLWIMIFWQLIMVGGVSFLIIYYYIKKKLPFGWQYKSKGENFSQEYRPYTVATPEMMYGLWSQSPTSLTNSVLNFFRKVFKYIGIACLVIVFIYGMTFLLSPSTSRDWTEDTQKLAQISISGNLVEVRDVRNFRYTTVTDWQPNYYDATYDASQIERVWYLIEPFSTKEGPAHTMLSFEFSDGRFLAVSAEIRKEKGESFAPIPALLHRFELVYIVADERDVIQLRSNYRKDIVRLYPTKSEKEDRRLLFLSMMQRAEKLRTNPEWYDLFFKTCTTSILDHVNELRNKSIPWQYHIFMPLFSDEIAYKHGLLDTDLPIEMARRKYEINERAAVASEENFSKAIRQ